MSLTVSVTPQKRGAALIVVLAFLVLLSGVVVAYLSRTTSDRQLAHGTFSGNRADILARSALDLVVADLKQEIVARSTASTINGYTIYTPNASTNMLPIRSGNPTGSPDPIPNLVRRSYRTDVSGVNSRASASNSATDLSLNNRSVTLARWNKHYLIPRASPTPSADSDTTPTTTFVAPDWVLVTRNGPAVKTAIGGGSTALNNATASNTNYVVGRYAYAIYDEGGLVDANVAGYPQPTPLPSPTAYVQRIGRKGASSFADLTQINLSFGAINDIVGWRSYSSVHPSGAFKNFTFPSPAPDTYVSSVLSNTTGFLTVSNTTVWNNGTDQMFPTRQSLLKFQADDNFSVAALQYLGTFSREWNRPTWKSATISAINSDLQAIRVATAFTRPDGSQAVVGEPLLNRRYLLTRINELTNTSDPNIQRDFGLRWDGVNIRWNYVGATGSAVQSSIKTLGQIATEIPGREPNFFELLKAIILNGSVGLGSGPSTTFIPSETKYYSTTGGLSADYQIMQIGANIIDCWDANNVPTFINFAGNELAGVENLPYLNKLVYVGSIPPQGSGGNVDAWLVPSLWNPHQNGSSATGTVRIALTGTPSYSATFTAGSTTATAGPIVTGPAITIDVPANGFMAPTPPKDPAPTPIATTGAVSTVGPPEKYYGFHFPFTSTTPNATAINQKNADTTYPDFGSVSGAGSIELEVFPGSLCTPSPTPSPAPTATPAPGAPLITTQPSDQSASVGQTATFSVAATGNAPLTYQWKKNGANISGATSSSYTTPSTAAADCGSLFAVVVTNTVGTATSNTVTLFVNGLPKTYQKWNIAATGHPLIAQSVKNNGDFQNTNKMADPEYVALDPRTLRFGVWGTDAAGQSGGNAKKDASYGAEDSLDQGPPANRIEQITWSGPQGSASNFTVSAVPTDLSLYATNAGSGSTNYYVDLDSLKRHGDWTTDPNGTNKGATIMYASAKTAPAGNYFDRPQILNGSFQSVAELGQVFRDQPWKTLNFTIANSADAGLLDVFTLQDVPLTAGRTSLNTRQYPVLAAILSQGGLRIDGTSIISSTQATNVAKAIVAAATAAPLLSKGDLVAKIAADVSFTGLANKEARECVMRALTDAGQTRTWNLMIDVIAQSGKYPPTAQGLADFVVEGEKRYWLHIAIDRFTGEVIDQQLEAVYE